MTEHLRSTQSIPLLSSSDLSLNLDKQKKRAKDLRDAVRSNDETAIATMRRHHPRFEALDPGQLKLADAQCAIAREAGLSSWPALKRHVDQIDAAKVAIEKGSSAPDGDLKTLHIRCGNDIEQALNRAGFAGDFLMAADPVCQGPVSQGPDAIRQRAEFIVGEYPGEDLHKTIDGLIEAERRISAAAEYERIVLWFEHDPYDQLILIRILANMRKTGADRRKIELISFDRFPGIRKFIGIGQLSPAALRHMYSTRKPVLEGAYAQAAKAWTALQRETPMPLFGLSDTSPALPFLGGSIERYLRELPSAHNGLSFSEQTALEILRDGPMPWGRVFHEFMMNLDPLPYHGDLMFLGTMIRLRDAGTPALASDPVKFDPENWGKAEFRITDVGKALLEELLDWKNCNPRPRWHGGVECFSDPDWRWSRNLQTPVSLKAG